MQLIQSLCILSCFILPGSVFIGLGSANADIGSRAIWVWQKEVAEQPTERQELLSFAQGHALTTVYLESEHLLQKNPTALKSFIAEAKKAGIQVELLFGNPEWVNPAHQSEAIALARKSVDFIRSLGPGFEVAMHFDIEPHALPGWKSHSQKISEAYLNLLHNLHGEARTGKVPLHVDVGFWYDQMTVQWQGRSRPLSECVIDEVDGVTLMDYRRTTQEIAHSAQSQIRYANWAGKKAIVGVESSPVNPNPEDVYREVGPLLQGNTGFGGFAIHDYKSYRLRSPGVHLDVKSVPGVAPAF